MSLQKSLLAWLKGTFPSVKVTDTLTDLSDGLALAQILHQIIPGIFGKEQLEKVVDSGPNNTPLKKSNLKKIISGLEDFYDIEVGSVGVFLSPDASKIASNDEGEMVKLLEAVLACAVQCESKEQYITGIMGLERTVSEQLMSSIQRSMQMHQEDTQSVSSSHAGGRHAHHYEEELNKARVEYDKLLHQFDESQKTIDSLKTELRQAEDHFQTKFALTTQEHMRRVQSEAEDLRLALEMEQAEVAAKNERVESLLREMSDAKGKLKDTTGVMVRLQDEVEELREQAVLVKSLEGQLQQCTDHIEQLNNKASELESSHTKLVLENLRLEEELKRAHAMQASSSESVAKLNKMESRVFELTRQLDKESFENKNLRDINDDLERNINRLKLEVRQAEASGKPQIALPTLAGLGETILSPEIKEKLIRLEAENALLKAQASGSTSEMGEHYEKLLSAANERKEGLETEVRALSLQVATLQADAKKGSVRQTSELAIEQLASAERQLSLTTQELAETRSKLEATEAELRHVQQELISVKKENSLVGLDQKEMIAELKRQHQSEIELSSKELQEKHTALETAHTKLSAGLQTATSTINDLETRLKELQALKEESDRVAKDRVGQVNQLLEEKVSLQEKLIAASDELNAKLREQELRFNAIMATQKGGEQGGVGTNKESLLELQLQISTMENKHMVKISEMERELMQNTKLSELAKIEKDNKLKELTVTLNSTQEKLKIITERAKLLKEENARLSALKRSEAKGGSEELVAQLQNQLSEKTKEIEFEKHSRERAKLQQESELRLLLTAWYDKGMEQQRAAGREHERMSSFLSRQRNTLLGHADA